MRPEVLAETIAEAIASVVGPLMLRVKASETGAATTAERMAALETTIGTLADRLLELEAARAVERQAR